MSQPQLILNRKSFIVEAMREEHLDQVVEMEQTCGLSLWGAEAYATELTRDNTIMLVARSKDARELFNRTAERQNQIHGFLAARINADELHINNIAVRLEMRRRGIGDELLRAALNEAVRRGAEWAVLEVRASNFAAQNLYARHGFEIVSKRPDYYRNPPEDAFVMGRQL